METKICKLCNEEKNISEFYSHPTSKNKIRARCKKCEIQRHNEYAKKNKYKILAKVLCECGKLICKPYLKKHKTIKNHDKMVSLFQSPNMD